MPKYGETNNFTLLGLIFVGIKFRELKHSRNLWDIFSRESPDLFSRKRKNNF